MIIEHKCGGLPSKYVVQTSYIQKYSTLQGIGVSHLPRDMVLCDSLVFEALAYYTVIVIVMPQWRNKSTFENIAMLCVYVYVARNIMKMFSDVVTASKVCCATADL